MEHTSPSDQLKNNPILHTCLDMSRPLDTLNCLLWKINPPAARTQESRRNKFELKDAEGVQWAEVRVKNPRNTMKYENDWKCIWIIIWSHQKSSPVCSKTVIFWVSSNCPATSCGRQRDRRPPGQALRSTSSWRIQQGLPNAFGLGDPVSPMILSRMSKILTEHSTKEAEVHM